jgi:hypothetical protein
MMPVKQIKHWLREKATPDLMFYVISHERSGTHFCINTIVHNTFLRPGFHIIPEWFGPYNNPSQRFARIDGFNQQWYKHMKTSAVIKSHCERSLFEKVYRPAKVVYVLRDPRDVMNSWFHYLNKDTFHENNPQAGNHYCDCMSEFLRRPIGEWLRYGSSLEGDFDNVIQRWASHVSGWLEAPNTLVVRYEERKYDYKTVLRKVSKFLGIRLRPVTRAVGLKDGYAIEPRKGQVGDWRNFFRPGDEAFIRSAVEDAGLAWRRVVYDQKVLNP